MRTDCSQSLCLRTTRNFSLIFIENTTVDILCCSCKRYNTEITAWGGGRGAVMALVFCPAPEDAVELRLDGKTDGFGDFKNVVQPIDSFASYDRNCL